MGAGRSSFFDFKFVVFDISLAESPFSSAGADTLFRTAFFHSLVPNMRWMALRALD
ncbi:hypothetical protein GXP70_18610 [Paenibacillus lycopersici]|uniref:Uncharacterized protein n=1 Tax=Paenibacillus lycopersici TaxID=2704462 RepID=A0A6C0G3C7_9BACL|nr:hypothetical protein [Paenibacillus lycopersici]QHT61789.1 hypothetical protein GXP70_18610 [Paenibacillus lycopersici]